MKNEKALREDLRVLLRGGEGLIQKRAEMVNFIPALTQALGVRSGPALRTAKSAPDHVAPRMIRVPTCSGGTRWGHFRSY